MKISARNQIVGKVTEVVDGAVNSEVVINAGNNSIKAIITKGSVKDMNIKTGDEIVTIIKASNVILAKDLPSKISARNVIKASVKNVQNGEVNSEISLDADGVELTSIITIGSTKELDIKVGDEVYAIIKASTIILAKN